MDEEPALPGQNQSVNDAEHGVDGIRVARLTNVTAASRRIPTGTEVAALKQPLTALQPYLYIVISVLCFRRIERVRGLEQIDVELELRI